MRTGHAGCKSLPKTSKLSSGQFYESGKRFSGHLIWTLVRGLYSSTLHALFG